MKKNPNAPYARLQIEIIEDTEVRSETLKALVIVSTISQKKDLLNHLWTLGHHYLAVFYSKPDLPGVERIRNVSNSFYYCALLMDIVDEYKKDLVDLANEIIDITYKTGGLARIRIELSKRLKKYEDKYIE